MNITNQAIKLLIQDISGYEIGSDTTNYEVMALTLSDSIDSLIGVRLARNYEKEGYGCVDIGDTSFLLQNAEWCKLLYSKAKHIKLKEYKDLLVTEAEITSKVQVPDVSNKEAIVARINVIVVDILTPSEKVEKPMNGRMFATEKDVPYTFQSHVVGHDGLTNTTIKDTVMERFDCVLKDGIEISRWQQNMWEGYNQYQYGYLTQQAKEFKVKTELTVMLKELEKDTILNYNNTGKPRKIYNYAIGDTVIIRIEAGSKSTFSSSDDLYAYKKFNSSEMDKIVAFIQEENKRIIGNVDPNANHNTVNSQMSDAFRNSRMSDN